MTFSQSTHLLMCLSLETLTSEWLTYSGRTSVSNNLTQMVNFTTWIPDGDSHNPSLLDLFLSSDAIICSTIAFPPLGNPHHVVVSVPIDFPSNVSLFHCIAYDYSHANCDGLCDYLRDVPWEDIFKLSASAASEFCEWFQVGIDVYIPHRKFQVKPPHPSGFQLLVLLP